MRGKHAFLGLSWETVSRASSRKFLHVKSCDPESSGFLRLCWKHCRFNSHTLSYWYWYCLRQCSLGRDEEKWEVTWRSLDRVGKPDSSLETITSTRVIGLMWLKLVIWHYMWSNTISYFDCFCHQEHKNTSHDGLWELTPLTLLKYGLHGLHCLNHLHCFHLVYVWIHYYTSTVGVIRSWKI